MPFTNKTRTIWSLSIVLAVALALGGLNLVASYKISEKEGQKQCAFVILLDDAYSKATPEQVAKSPILQQLQTTLHNLRASLGCKPRSLQEVGSK